MVNPPEAAIVALGRTRAVPLYGGRDGATLERGHLMGIAWGADHRVVDGASVAEFSNTWKGLLEQPERLLLCMR
jgi:2-oxoisovalerate dehydrogenase E2 component (dihydrolipoyl transacylase)